jgi:hypothetical protein
MKSSALGHPSWNDHPAVHWLEFQLHELAAVLGPEGHRAVLYCGACEGDIPYADAAAGAVHNWPYCPVHHENPLMICSASLYFPSARVRTDLSTAMAMIPVERAPTMQYSARPRAAKP